MKFHSLALLACCLAVGCSSGVFLEQARPVPNLSAPNQYGKTVSLQQACGGPWAVVFFYPEADTPG